MVACWFPETLARAADAGPLPEMLTQKAAFLGMRTALPESAKEVFLFFSPLHHYPGADSQRVFPAPLAQAFMLLKGSLCPSQDMEPGHPRKCGMPCVTALGAPWDRWTDLAEVKGVQAVLLDK